MPRINRIEPSSSSLQVQGVQGVQAPQFLNFQDLRTQYRFPGSQQLLAWKQGATSQESHQKFSHIFQAPDTSQEGFRRISLIGDGTNERAQDDRAAIGLILNAINSDTPEVKRTGLQYMQALLDQSSSPEKRKFVYDSIVNNLINAVGWTIEEKHDYHSGREILSGLDTFSLMILRQYNIYPNLDLQSLLQPRGLSHRVIEGSSDFHDVRAHLQGRMLQGDDQPQRLQEDENGASLVPQLAEFHDISGFTGFNDITIIFGGEKLRLSDLMAEVAVRI